MASVRFAAGLVSEDHAILLDPQVCHSKSPTVASYVRQYSSVAELTDLSMDSVILLAPIAVTPDPLIVISPVTAVGL